MKLRIFQGFIVLVHSFACLFSSISAVGQVNCEAKRVFSEYSGPCITYNRDYYCINADLPYPLSNATNTTFTWLMGDGGTKTGKKIQYCYKNYGKYTITLLAKSYINRKLLIDTTYHEVNIFDFAIFSTKKLENKQFYFDASESFIDNDFQVEMYYWDYGDGSFECGEMNPLVHHQYKELGTYEVRLIVEGKNTDGKKKKVCGMQQLRVE